MNQTTMDSLLEGVNRTKYYRYQGSLTIPDCTEAVIWTVFKDPIKVSQDLVSQGDSIVEKFIKKSYSSMNGWQHSSHAQLKPKSHSVEFIPPNRSTASAQLPFSKGALQF